MKLKLYIILIFVLNKNISFSNESKFTPLNLNTEYVPVHVQSFFLHKSTQLVREIRENCKIDQIGNINLIDLLEKTKKISWRLNSNGNQLITAGDFSRDWAVTQANLVTINEAIDLESSYSWLRSKMVPYISFHELARAVGLSSYDENYELTLAFIWLSSHCEDYDMIEKYIPKLQIALGGGGNGSDSEGGSTTTNGGGSDVAFSAKFIMLSIATLWGENDKSPDDTIPELKLFKSKKEYLKKIIEARVESSSQLQSEQISIKYDNQGIKYYLISDKSFLNEGVNKNINSAHLNIVLPLIKYISEDQNETPRNTD